MTTEAFLNPLQIDIVLQSYFHKFCLLLPIEQRSFAICLSYYTWQLWFNSSYPDETPVPVVNETSCGLAAVGKKSTANVDPG